MKKNYVLDTNILIHCPSAIFGFDDNNVIITTTTLQELDSKKTAYAEVGYGAREAIRNIEKLDGDYSEGVQLLNGGLFRIARESDYAKKIPSEYSLEKPDNRIINAVLGIAASCELETILVTNDVSMRINATMCGCTVQGYHNEMILDDAIMRMEMLSHSFFIYKDIDSEKIAVVYKRESGGYGLIEVTE